MARACPSPYGKTGRSQLPSRGGLSPAIARPARKTHAALGCFPLNQGTARDRPSPYGEGEVALHTVARGPVPRARPARRTHAVPGCFPRDRCMARACPSPYGKTGRSQLPSRGGLSPAIVRPARRTHAAPGGFPLDRGTARDRPSPYGKTGRSELP